MNLVFNKRQIISLIILLFLVFILPLALFLVRQRQEVRKKAAGTGVLQLRLEPENITKNRGDSINYTVKLTNTTSSSVQIRVVGVEFAVKPSVNDFEISQINCASSLPSKAFGDVFEGKVRLVCYKPPGSTGPSEPLTIPASSTIDVGSFQITIKSSAVGVYKLSSKEADGGRNNIPQETTLADLSDIGAEASITIAGAPITGTPTPTTTPSPTPTPTGTVTPTPTTTPPPGECPNGENGNLNCDSQGLIDELDFAILLLKWHTNPTTPLPTPNSGQRSADIAGNDNLVDELDFAKMLLHWKTH